MRRRLQDAVDGIDQFLRVAMLADELEGAVTQGTNGRVDRLVAAEDHDRRRDVLLHHPLHDFQAADVGQIEIEDEDVDVASFESALASLPVPQSSMLRPAAASSCR
jgi:hypothetical protein